MSKSRPWLNIQPNETAVIEIQDVRGEQEFDGSNGSYTKWLYDVIHEGKEKTLGATKGLQTVLEAHALRTGDVISITRSGGGLNTRWAVAFERGDPRAPVRGPNINVKPGATVDDLWATFDGMHEALKLRHPELPADTLAMMASVLASAALGLGLLFPGYGGSEEAPRASAPAKTTPAGFVKAMMLKAKVPISQQDALGRMLFGEHIITLDDVTREDATLLYSLTEDGTNPVPLVAQYENMTGDDGDDLPGLPF